MNTTMDSATVRRPNGFFYECIMDHACEQIWSGNDVFKWMNTVFETLNKVDFAPPETLDHKIRLCLFLMYLHIAKRRALKRGTTRFHNPDELCKKFQRLVVRSSISIPNLRSVKAKLRDWLLQDEITAEECQDTIDEVKGIFKPAYKKLKNVNFDEACLGYMGKLSEEVKPRAGALKSVFLMKHPGTMKKALEDWDTIINDTHPDVISLKQRMLAKHRETQSPTKRQVRYTLPVCAVVLKDIGMMPGLLNKYYKIQSGQQASQHSPQPSTSSPGPAVSKQSPQPSMPKQSPQPSTSSPGPVASKQPPQPSTSKYSPQLSPSKHSPQPSMSKQSLQPSMSKESPQLSTSKHTSPELLFSSDDSDSKTISATPEHPLLEASIEICLETLNQSFLNKIQCEPNKLLLPGSAISSPVKHSTPNHAVTRPEATNHTCDNNERSTIQKLPDSTGGRKRVATDLRQCETISQTTPEINPQHNIDFDADTGDDAVCDSDVYWSPRSKMRKKVKKILESDSSNSEQEMVKIPETQEHVKRNETSDVAESATAAAQNLALANKQLMNVVQDPYDRPSTSSSWKDQDIAYVKGQRELVTSQKAAKVMNRSSSEEVSFSEEINSGLPPPIVLPSPKVNKDLLVLDFVNDPQDAPLDIESPRGEPRRRREPRRKRRYWRMQEEEWLREGVEMCGVGNWTQILQSYPFVERTAIDLKDKYRNMKKNGEFPGHES